MIFGLIGSLITGGFSLAKEYIGGKNTEKKLELENAQNRIKNQGFVERAAAEAKAKAMLERMEGDVKWENIWARGAQQSWKDEFWTLVLAYPFLLNLIPATIATIDDPMNASAHVLTAFTQMGKIPTYWTVATGTAIGAAFGVRKATDFFAAKKGV